MCDSETDLKTVAKQQIMQKARSYASVSTDDIHMFFQVSITDINMSYFVTNFLL